MSLTANQINGAIDIALDQLKTRKLKHHIRKNEIAMWTHGELTPGSVNYAVAVIISSERNLTDEFHENFNAWLKSKGMSTTRVSS